LRFPDPPITSSKKRDLTQEKIVFDIRKIIDKAKNISASILRQEAHIKYS
jgi:hypothetical protein